MSDYWLGEIDKGNLVGAVMLDFSAAFDVINHDICLAKLKSYGFEESAIKWVQSYLGNRKQAVFVNGSFSSYKESRCGVPQGSCLGPLLFSIFVNDLPAVTNSIVVMYADDSTPSASAPTVAKLKYKLQTDLERIWNWVQTNHLVLNIGKTKSIMMGTQQKLKRNPKLELRIDGTDITHVEQAELLGLTIDQRLTWGSHIDKTKNKMAGILATIRRHRKYFTKSILRSVIQALVLSHIDYGSVLLSSAPQTHIDGLQVVQNRAARLATNKPFDTNLEDLHMQLKWQTVKERLFTNTVCTFHKIVKERQPQCIFKQLQTIQSTHEHHTRLSTRGAFTQSKPKTNAKTRTFGYRCIKTYNTLPNTTTSYNNIEFKSRIKELAKTRDKRQPLSTWW